MNYPPFLRYLKQKHGVNALYELLYLLPPLPNNETVEGNIP